MRFHIRFVEIIVCFKTNICLIGVIYPNCWPFLKEFTIKVSMVDSLHPGFVVYSIDTTFVGSIWTNSWFASDWDSIMLKWHPCNVHDMNTFLPGWRPDMSLCSYRDDSRFAPSQWETALLCNDVSHWLGASLELGWYWGFLLAKRTIKVSPCSH